MKPIYTTWAYWCKSCGRYAWESRIPEGKQAKDAMPVRCGKCGGHKFEARKAA
jgi:DNA-directed RNA polymerase subunit RPC12/RpoP